MIIATLNGKSYNTERDLTDQERRLLQELIIWEALASSIASRVSPVKTGNHNGILGLQVKEI